MSLFEIIYRKVILFQPNFGVLSLPGSFGRKKIFSQKSSELAEKKPFYRQNPKKTTFFTRKKVVKLIFLLGY